MQQFLSMQTGSEVNSSVSEDKQCEDVGRKLSGKLRKQVRGGPAVNFAYLRRA